MIASIRFIECQLIADMQQAQLMMVAGMVMLGWVLARRQIKMRKKANQEEREANQALKRIRDHKDPAVPLCDAPAETQRWQAAMFDLQRELKADLDTRIAVVQTLLRQVDQRIETLATMEPCPQGSTAPAPPMAGTRHHQVQQMLQNGHTAKEIAVETGMPLGDVEMTISTIRPG